MHFLLVISHWIKGPLSVTWKSLRVLQIVNPLLHSADAWGLAVPVRCEIMKEILERSVGNAWGVNSKWIEQSMINVLHSPGSPEHCAGGANLLPAPTCRVGGVGTGAGTVGRGICASSSCSWDVSWPICTTMAVWNSFWREMWTSWACRTPDNCSASAGSILARVYCQAEAGRRTLK